MAVLLDFFRGSRVNFSVRFQCNYGAIGHVFAPRPFLTGHNGPRYGDGEACRQAVARAATAPRNNILRCGFAPAYEWANWTFSGLAGQACRAI
jgi:hypothetical protein